MRVRAETGGSPKALPACLIAALPTRRASAHAAWAAYRRVDLSARYRCRAENTWQLLENAIHEINNHNASGLSFEELYR
jgi:hypothetical protein